jgi:paired amphipathic helix protein Sin3a
MVTRYVTLHFIFHHEYDFVVLSYVVRRCSGGHIDPQIWYGCANTYLQRLKTAQGPKVPTAPELPSATPSLVPPLPQPLPPTVTTGATPEDVGFFDRARKHIGNKSLFGEFLKLCNLYTNDLVSADYFNHKAENFLGGAPELLMWLKNFVGSGPVLDTEITNQEKTANMNGKIHLSNCRGLGPSYRLLPKAETNKKCSGRDDLCNSVLNDEWVSHPTWASEDSGFVAHRKNVHEEGLHRIEEERHDYDYHMEICARTIQLLEPIAQALATSTAESRRNFNLDRKLGGQSEAIYKRVILKIYGRERGHDVLENLFGRPYDVVPVLLARLKTKYQEWKAAQIQWERVWRTQTNQMFYKSLDHQGVATRVGDKRQFWPKQLVNEIVVKYTERKRKRELSSISLPAWQYAYEFHNKDVLLDAARLLTAYVDQNLSTEWPNLEKFITEFLSLFFLIDAAEFGHHGTQATGSPAVDTDAPSPGTEDGRSQKSRQQNLYRSTLDRGRSTRRDNDGSASDSRGTSPAAHSVVDEEVAESVPSPAAQDSQKRTKWFDHPQTENFLNGESIKPNEKYSRSTYVMYGNGAIYCFVRLFCLLYERLAAIKANEAEAHVIVKRAMQHKPATDLGWIEKTPSDFFKDTSPSANLYSQMLGMFDQLIRGDVEMSHIEEALRRYYLQDGWQLYSLDKLLGSISRFAVSMVASDPREKSAEIYNLFKKDRLRGKETSHQEELNYRRQVDKHIKDADIFRIAYVSAHAPNKVVVTNSNIEQDELDPTVYIQLFKPEDPTFEPSSMSEADIWKVYVSAFEDIEPTEGTQYIRTPSIPYMRRVLRQQWGEDQPGLERALHSLHNTEGMQFRVGMKEYKLLFEPEASETTLTTWSRATAAEVAQEAERRGGAASESFQANSEWMKGLSRDDVDEKKQTFSTIYA